MSLCHQGQARKSGDDTLLLTRYAGKGKAAVRRLSQEGTRSRGDKLSAPDLLTREYLPGSLSPPKISVGLWCRAARRRLQGASSRIRVFLFMERSPHQSVC